MISSLQLSRPRALSLPSECACGLVLACSGRQALRSMGAAG